MNVRNGIQGLNGLLPACRKALAWTGLLFTGVSPGAQSHPNVVFILADDLGYGDVACYNPESKIPTPNLDRLAKEGMLFTDAHSPSTVCTPTRYSVLTGRMAFRLNYKGVFTGVGGPCLITPDRLTLPGMLRKKGYETAMFGKWHAGLTAFDKKGKPINRNGLDAVKRSIIPAPSKGDPWTADSIISLVPQAVRPRIGSMPTLMGIAFPFRPPKSWTAVLCPNIRIPGTTGRA